MIARLYHLLWSDLQWFSLLHASVRYLLSEALKFRTVAQLIEFRGQDLQ